MSDIFSKIGEGINGCFGSYLFYNSLCHAYLSTKRTELQNLLSKENQDLEVFLNEQQKKHDIDMLTLRRQWMQEKLDALRQSRYEEIDASNDLLHKKQQLSIFVDKYLPIESCNIDTLLDKIATYQKSNYTKDCDICVLLLHTKHAQLNAYEEIHTYLNNKRGEIGNVFFPAWCETNAEHNVSIFNLHALMRGMPSIIISPYFHERASRMHFTVSMWTPWGKHRPLISPFCSIVCNEQDFLQPKELIKRIGAVSLLIAGCARDIYMLYVYGETPTLPNVIESDAYLQDILHSSDVKNLKEQILEEYKRVSVNSKLHSEMLSIISDMSNEAYTKILKIG